MIDASSPVGNLPFGVVGIKKSDNHLQVINRDEPARLYESPLKFREVTWDQVLMEASKFPVAKKPRNRLNYLDNRNHWHQFNAWQYRHWWEGDPSLLRIHAFFRTVRQVPTTSNIYRQDKHKINYIDAKSSPGHFKEFKKAVEVWEDVYAED